VTISFLHGGVVVTLIGITVVPLVGIGGGTPVVLVAGVDGALDVVGAPLVVLDPGVVETMQATMPIVTYIQTKPTLKRFP